MPYPTFLNFRKIKKEEKEPQNGEETTRNQEPKWMLGSCYQNNRGGGKIWKLFFVNPKYTNVKIAGKTIPPQGVEYWKK